MVGYVPRRALEADGIARRAPRAASRRERARGAEPERRGRALRSCELHRRRGTGESASGIFNDIFYIYWQEPKFRYGRECRGVSGSGAD